MIYKNIRNTKGFSLMEVIIYIALISILMTGLVSFSLSVSASQLKGRSMEEILSTNRFVSETLEYYLKNRVKTVTTPLPLKDSGKFSAILSDSQTFNIFLSDRVLKLRVGSDEYNLTNARVEVSNLSFKYYQTATGLSSIRMTCLLNFKNNISKEYKFEYDFSKTINLKTHE